MKNKPKLVQNWGKIKQKTNKIEGNLHLVQYRALSKYFVQPGCNSKNLPISEF